MKSAAPCRILLGPQRPTVNLDKAEELACIQAGPLAVISAGWQEAENDIDHVREVISRPLDDLCLYARAEEILASDKGMAGDYRRRQDRLMEQQRLYRIRLKSLARAAREVLTGGGDPDMLAVEQRHAVAQLRALDRHHLHRTESICREFDESYNVAVTPSLARHNAEIQEVLQRCSGVLITGGNVAVLLNRIRLFGVDELLQEQPIIAWSAGAMVLAERVVLFHDRTPEGRREPEVLGAGCSILSGLVVMPDASRRLRENDRQRAGLMSRRFSPDTCVMIDSGTLLQLSDSTPVHADGIRKIDHDGRFTKVRAA